MIHPHVLRRIAIAMAAAAALGVPVIAVSSLAERQRGPAAPRALTAADYARAEKMKAPATPAGPGSR